LKNSCRVRDWRGTWTSIRFQPLPIRTVHEVFPHTAHPVNFIERVMCRVRMVATFISHSLTRAVAELSSPSTARVPRRGIRYSIAAIRCSSFAAVSAELKGCVPSSPYTRSATLAPAPALPTRGYSSRLLDEISSPGAEGFSSCHTLLLTMSSLIPRRREPPHRTRFDRLLLLSHIIDRLSPRVFV
jgi:hypothetical protein